jgi:hypothetical protein
MTMQTDQILAMRCKVELPYAKIAQRSNFVTGKLQAVQLISKGKNLSQIAEILKQILH